MANIFRTNTVKFSDGSSISSGQLLNSSGNIAIDFNNQILSGNNWTVNGVAISSGGGGGGGGGTGTNVQVTGSSNLVTANFSGVSGTSVILSGNNILIGNITGVFPQLNSANTFTSINGFSGSVFSVTGSGGLFSFDGKSGIDWNLRQLYNPNGLTLDWNQKILYNIEAAVKSVDWGNGILYDSNQIFSLNWYSKMLSGTWNATGLQIQGVPVVTTAYPFFLVTNAPDIVSGTITFISGMNVSGNSIYSGINAIYFGGMTSLPFSGNNNSGIGILLGNSTLASASAGVEVSPSLNFSGNYYGTGVGFTGNVPVSARMYVTGTSGNLNASFGTIPQFTIDLSTGFGLYQNGFSLSNSNTNPYINATINGNLSLTNGGVTATAGSSFLAAGSQVGGSAIVTVNQTGAFYPSFSNPSGFITTGQTGAFGGSGSNTNTFTNGINVSGTANFTGNLNVTGGGIFQSGFQVVTSNQTGGFGTGSVITGGLTGVFWPLLQGVSTVNGNFNLTFPTPVYLVNTLLAGTNTGTLPTAVGLGGYEFTIKDLKGNASLNPIHIGTTSSQKIDNSSSGIININYQSMSLISDGSNWYIV